MRREQSYQKNIRDRYESLAPFFHRLSTDVVIPRDLLERHKCHSKPDPILCIASHSRCPSSQ